MMTGPPKKPSKLKMLEGTWRADRVSPNEPMPEAAMPPVPRHLSKEARAEWKRISTELMQLGMLTRIDRAALAAYCECWSDWVDASNHCSILDGKDRKVIKTQHGNFMESPYYTIKKRSMELMHKFLVEFGMTPASRTRINAIPQDGKSNDPSEQFFGPRPVASSE